MFQQQGDEQTADASVAVQVWMDGLELDMQQAGAHQRRQGVFAVHVVLEVTELIGKDMVRRGHEDRVAGPGAADPVLAPTHLTRLVLRSANAPHQEPMGLVQKAYGKRQATLVGDLGTSIGECIEVVADVFQVRIRGCLCFCFETQ